MQENKMLTIQSEAWNVYKDTRTLTSKFENGELKREDADTLANGYGKSLKALSLVLADQQFTRELKNITPPKTKALQK